MLYENSEILLDDKQYPFEEWWGSEEYMALNSLENVFLKFPKVYTLMQCTGRKDQNGVLIYEGDIVERDNTDGVKRGVVEFSDSFTVFRATNMSKFSLFERAVVIGNIYENKELLETFTKYGYLKK